VTLLERLKTPGSTILDPAIAGGLDRRIGHLVAFVYDPTHGGFRGLVDRFEQCGLGEAMRSWVGRGSNRPVTAEQLTAALGGRLRRLGAALDMPSDQLAARLCTVLPVLIDGLTPTGKLPPRATARPPGSRRVS